MFLLLLARALAGQGLLLGEVTHTFIPEGSDSPVDLPVFVCFDFLLTFTDKQDVLKRQPRESQGFQTCSLTMLWQLAGFPSGSGSP